MWRLSLSSASFWICRTRSRVRPRRSLSTSSVSGSRSCRPKRPSSTSFSRLDSASIQLFKQALDLVVLGHAGRVDRQFVGHGVAQRVLVLGAVHRGVQRPRRLGHGQQFARPPARRGPAAPRRPRRARPRLRSRCGPQRRRGRSPACGARAAPAAARAPRAPAAGSRGPGSSPRARRTGGSTRWRRSRSGSRARARTCRWRASGRGCPPRSGPTAARRGPR